MQQNYPNPFNAEIPRDAAAEVIDKIVHEVDNRSSIHISFDESQMRATIHTDEGWVRQVEIQVEALLVQGATATQSIRLDNYSSQHSSGALVQHSKPFDPATGAGATPDAFVDLRMHKIDGYDGIKIRVTNLVTQESIERLLVPKAFGFRGKISDSILFVRRVATISKSAWAFRSL